MRTASRRKPRGHVALDTYADARAQRRERGRPAATSGPRPSPAPPATTAASGVERRSRRTTDTADPASIQALARACAAGPCPPAGPPSAPHQLAHARRGSDVNAPSRRGARGCAPQAQQHAAARALDVGQLGQQRAHDRRSRSPAWMPPAAAARYVARPRRRSAGGRTRRAIRRRQPLRRRASNGSSADPQLARRREQRRPDERPRRASAMPNAPPSGSACSRPSRRMYAPRGGFGRDQLARRARAPGTA